MGRGFVVKSLPCGSVRAWANGKGGCDGVLSQPPLFVRSRVAATVMGKGGVRRSSFWRRRCRRSYSTDEKGYEHAKKPERIDACAHGEAGNGASDVSDQINGGNDVRRVSIGFRQKQTEASREAHARCHAEGSGCEKEGGELFERHE